ncbi:membrane protein [Streptomyces aureoverticillatus]|nr:membrane protein [Streptomyces aureoverticillatus]
MGFDGAVRSGTSQARRVAKGRVVETAARAGFVARGVMYVLVGVLALRIALADDGGQQADRGGALTEIADKPFGNALLWLLGVALAGMALWRLSEALFGQAGPDGHKARKRLASAGRSVFYCVVSYTVLAYVAGDKGSGSGSTDRQSDDVTATALDWPSGQWIVGAVGAGVVVAGLWIAGRAMLRKYRDHLRMSEMSAPVRRTVDVLGVAGGIGRGCVFAAAGAFVLVAAVRHKPGEAKGMDDVLRSFRDTPAGPWLLVAVALALVAFGFFSWASARWRKV